jgi:hypothetical protein
MASHQQYLKAHVENGRIVVDEPLDLPDGTPLTVVVGTDVGEEVERSPDELTDSEREIQRKMPWVRFAREPAPPLQADEKLQLERSLDQAARGDVAPHDRVMRELGLEEFSTTDDAEPDGR